MSDYYYEDCDEDGQAYESQRLPKWRNPAHYDPLTVRALAACGRKAFSDRREYSRWNAVRKSAIPYSPYVKPAKYWIEWLENCIAWAEAENNRYRASTLSHAVKITFPALLSLVENQDRQQDWLARAIKSGQLETREADWRIRLDP